MSGLAISLVGRPAVSVDGVESAPPRGSKAWAILAHLASSTRSHPRSELAELFVERAGAPLGALRRNLAALRRLLQLSDALEGDSISRRLPARATVGVRLVEARDPTVLLQPGLGPELLAGLNFPDRPASPGATAPGALGVEGSSGPIVGVTRILDES